MYKMSEIIEIIEELCPRELAMEGDNVGLILGRADADVTRVLLALDVTDDVIEEALEEGCDAIVTHHPLLRNGMKQINDSTPQGHRLLTLAENRIAVYSAHTNLDMCDGGINDELFDMLGLENRESIAPEKPSVFSGRAGFLPEPMKLSEFALFVKERLELPGAIYCGNPLGMVRKVGIIAGGSANERCFTGVAMAECDTFITSDIKYSAALLARDFSLNLVDATHYGSEIVFTRIIEPLLNRNFPNLEVIVSQIDGQPFRIEN